MTDPSPFSQSYHQDDNYQRPKQMSGSAKVLIGLGVVILVCGLGGLAFVATQRIAGSRTSLRPPDREQNSFAADASDFNASIQQRLNSQDQEDASQLSADAELVAFIERSLDTSINGIEIPLNSELFIEAVGKSKWNTSQLTLYDRFLLRQWIGQYLPVPEAVTEDYLILSINAGSTPEFASTDIVYYSQDDQTLSMQWFLAKEHGRWTVYDWQQLEYGRRASDEYAAYLRGSESVSEGFDSALIMAADAESLWNDGENEAAKRKLRRAERIRTLPQDRGPRALRIAYTWIALGEYEEALRLLDTVQNPGELWGVWPSKSLCHYALGDNEAALVAIDKAALQSPDHPNVHWFKTVVHGELGNDDLAAKSAIKLLRLCPNDVSVAQQLLGLRRPQDIGVLLKTLVDVDEEAHWRQLINSARYDSDWARALIPKLDQHKSVPRGMQEMIQGNVAWLDDQHEQAATQYVAASKVATQDYIRDMAMANLVSVRSEKGQYAQLFSETNDRAKLLQDMFELAIYDELESDPKKLLEAIEVTTDLPDGPAKPGLLGWCLFQDEQYALARKEFEVAFAELSQLAEEDDPDSLVGDVKYYITKSFLNEDKPVEALKRFPSDQDNQQLIGDVLARSNKQSVVADFLDATEQHADDMVQLQRQRIMAYQAFTRGDDDACDEHYLQSLTMAKGLYDSSSWYRVRQLVSRRATHLAWQRHWRPASGYDFQFPELDEKAVHAQVFARESARLFDSDSLNACLEAIDSDPIADSEFALLKWYQGAMLGKQGLLKPAAKAMETSVAKTESESAHLANSRKKELADLHLRLGDTDAARMLLKDLDEEVPADVLIQLAQGNLAGVQESLAKLKYDVASDWLQDYDNRHWLLQHHQVKGFAGLLNAFPMYFGYGQSAASGSVYLKSNNKIDEAFLHGVLAEASPDQKFTIKPVSISPSKSVSQQAFVATSGQRRILFHYRNDIRYNTDNLAAELRSRFEQPVNLLDISILDRQPHATPRLFKVARSACRDAFAFQWGGGESIWVGDDLVDQLKWIDRVPLPSDRLAAVLYFQSGDDAEDDTSDVKQLDIKQWDQQLQDAGGPVEVVMTRAQGLTNEAIRADLIEVDQEEGRLTVVAKADSLISPIIQKGIKYHCTVYRIRLAKPKK